MLLSSDQRNVNIELTVTNWLIESICLHANNVMFVMKNTNYWWYRNYTFLTRAECHIPENHVK